MGKPVNKKAVNKEETVSTEGYLKRDSSNDLALTLAAIWRSLEEIRRAITVIEQYSRLDHGGDI